MLETIVFDSPQVPIWQNPGSRTLIENSIKANQRLFAQLAADHFVVIGGSEASISFTNPQTYAGRTGSTINESAGRFVKINEVPGITAEYVPYPYQRLILKQNSDPRLDKIEHKVYSELKARGFSVPTCILDANGLVLEHVEGSTLKDFFSRPAMNCEEQYTQMLKDSITLVANLGTIIGTILSPEDKAFLRDFDETRLASSMNTPLETVQKNYYLLRLLQSTPGATSALVPIYSPLAQKIKEAHKTDSTWEADLHPENLIVGPQNKIYMIDFNRLRPIPRQVQIARLIDAFMPIYYFGAIPCQTSIFGSAGTLACYKEKAQFFGFYERVCQQIEGKFPNEGKLNVFGSHLQACRAYFNIITANKALHELSKADSYSAILEKSFEANHHLILAQEALSLLHLQEKSKPNYSGEFQMIKESLDTTFGNVLKSIIPERIYQDVDEWNKIS